MGVDYGGGGRDMRSLGPANNERRKQRAGSLKTRDTMLAYDSSSDHEA